MKDDDDLEKLKKFVRGRYVRRKLVCPECEGPVELRDYLLHCGCCGKVTRALSELKSMP